MSEKFKSRKALVIYGITALCVCFLCVLLRFISTVFFFDYRIGYYISGAPLPIIANILPIVAAVCALAIYAIPALRLSVNTPTDTKSVNIGSWIAALGFVLFSVIYLISLANYLEIYGKLPISYIVGALASLSGCAFFILKALGHSSKLSYVLCGILTVIWFVLALIESYFDTFVQMNSPIKLVFQFACLGAMLLIVSEMRMGVDNTRSRMHLLSATLAAILLPMSSVPSIICYYMGKMPATYTLLYYDAVCVLMSAFAIIRVVQLCFFAPAEPAEALISEDFAQEVTSEEKAVSEDTEVEE